MSMPSVQEIGPAPVKGTGTDSFSSEKKGVMPTFQPLTSSPNKSLEPPFPHPHDLGPPSASWIPGEPVNLSKGSPDMPSPYWRNESPMTPGFSSFAPGLHLSHHTTWSPAATEPSPREEFGWSLPQRSMSYGSHETLLQHSNYSFHPTTNGRDDFSNRPSPHPLDVYSSLPPTTGSLSTADVATVMTPTTTTPQSSGSAPPFPAVQGWQPYPYKVPAVPSNGEGYPGWFGPASNMSSSVSGTDGDGIPPVPTYGHPDSYHGMYYQNTNPGR